MADSREPVHRRNCFFRQDSASRRFHDETFSDFQPGCRPAGLGRIERPGGPDSTCRQTWAALDRRQFRHGAVPWLTRSLTSRTARAPSAHPRLLRASPSKNFSAGSRHGLTFSGAFFAAAGTTVDYAITYTVTASQGSQSPTPTLSGVFSNFGGTGAVSVGETLLNAATGIRGRDTGDFQSTREHF